MRWRNINVARLRPGRWPTDRVVSDAVIGGTGTGTGTGTARDTGTAIPKKYRYSVVTRKYPKVPVNTYPKGILGKVRRLMTILGWLIFDLKV